MRRRCLLQIIRRQLCALSWTWSLLMEQAYGGPLIARTVMNYSELIAGQIFSLSRATQS